MKYIEVNRHYLKSVLRTHIRIIRTDRTSTLNCQIDVLISVFWGPSTCLNVSSNINIKVWWFIIIMLMTTALCDIMILEHVHYNTHQWKLYLLQFIMVVILFTNINIIADESYNVIPRLLTNKSYQSYSQNNTTSKNI